MLTGVTGRCGTAFLAGADHRRSVRRRRRLYATAARPGLHHLLIFLETPPATEYGADNGIRLLAGMAGRMSRTR